MQETKEPKKIASQTLCHRCHGVARQQIWRSGTRLFEVVVCGGCQVEEGRINGGPWHTIKHLAGDESSESTRQGQTPRARMGR